MTARFGGVEELRILGEEGRQRLLQARRIPRIVGALGDALRSLLPLPPRQRVHQQMHLRAHAGRERPRALDELQDPEGLDRALPLLLPSHQELGVEQALPLLEQARVGELDGGAEEAEHVLHRLGLGDDRDVLLERPVELREVAQKNSFAPLEAVALHVVVEGGEGLPHLPPDRLGRDVAPPDPGVEAGEAVEVPGQPVGERLGVRDPLELLHPLLVLDPLRLHFGERRLFGAIDLLAQDDVGIFEHRLDQGEQIAHVGRMLRLEQRNHLDQEERERVVEREVELEVGGDHDPPIGGARVATELQDPRPAERPHQDRGVAEVPAFGPLVLVAAGHQLAERREVPPRRVVELLVPLQEVEHHAVRDPEAGLERLGGARDQPFERLLRPDDLGPPAALRRRRLLPFLSLLRRAQPVDRLLGRLRHHGAALVEPLAAGAAGDLLEVADRQNLHLLAVELGELREQHRANRDVDADPQRVGAADHLQQGALRELLDEEAVLREQPGVVDPDSEREEAPDLLAVGGVEPEVADRLADRLPLLAPGHAEAGQRLRELGALALREVDDVDGRLPRPEQLLDRLLERRLPVLEVERHRSMRRGDDGDRDAGRPFELLRDAGHVPQCRRHEEEARPRQRDERHLPGPAALVVGVVVELVERRVGGGETVAFAQRHVGQHLGRAADHPSLRVDRRVAGPHADVGGAEVVAEREELLRGERLDRAGVEGDLAARQRQEVHPQRHHRLAGAGRGREDDVLARVELEQCLLLVRIEREAGVGRPADEAVEQLVGGEVPPLGKTFGEARPVGHRGILSPSLD